MAAKRLAAADTRIEGYQVDDFSTGSIECGVKPEHVAALQFLNATRPPHLMLGATVYTVSLDRPELPALLPYFAHFIVPLWDADRIESLAADIDRLAQLSGDKPMLLCLYVYDWGSNQTIPRELMQRHLDVAEDLILSRKVTGLLLCGTCMMDLDWEANRCFYDWIEKVGDQAL